ncbi:hypothetical protein DMN57_17785 [Escherichia coli]|nr:hypothetical protein [Escherichia coli]
MVWLVWRKAAKSKWSTVWVNLPGLTPEVEGENGKTVINFDNAIIAAGSRPIQLPFIPHEDPRIWDSTDALELKEVPERLLVMGGGIIGLEMGTVYHALGSQIDVVEMFDRVIPQLIKTSLKSLPSVSARNST